MKTSSSSFVPTSLGFCFVMILFFASNLPGQNPVTSSRGDTNAVRENIAALQTRVARALPPTLAETRSTNQFSNTSEGQDVMEASQARAFVFTEQAQAAQVPPGGAQKSLVVNSHLLNVDFGLSTKTGLGAIGQTANDYWNPYVKPNYSLVTLQNILWSDQSASPVDITVANAPGQWGNGMCLDPMYASFIYPWDSGHISQ
jgi:hypothetical protein